MADDPRYSSVQFMGIRVTKVDVAGHPVVGSKNGYFTKAVIDATPQPDLQAATENTQVRGDGAVCSSFKDCDILKRFKLDLTLCHLDAGLLAFLTGATVITDVATGLAIGFESSGPNTPCPNGVILEAWSKAWNGSAQAAPDFAGNAATYFHFVFPRYTAQLGQMKIDQGILQVPVTGQSNVNAFMTVNGPYDDWPSSVATRGGVSQPMAVFMDTSFPTVAEGYLNVTALAS